MKWFRRFLDFFRRKDKVKMLNEATNTKKVEEKNRFIKSIKLDTDFSFLYKNKVETHVSNGDGLGINTKIKYSKKISMENTCKIHKNMIK